MDIQAIAKDYKDYQIEMRRWFHQHPEIAEKEFETSAKVQEELDKYGISWRHPKVIMELLNTNSTSRNTL